MERILRLVVLAAVALASPRAFAGTVTFSDGLVHTINSAQPNTNFVVSGGSTLDIAPGAAITVADSSFGSNGVTASGAGTTINATGGSVTGGAATFAGATGSNGLSVSASVTLGLSGGTFTGGAGSNGGDGLFAAITPSAGPFGTRTISGGTFVGGNSTDAVAGIPGVGASVARNVTITGGTFTPGSGGQAALVPTALAVATGPGEVATVSGGVYQGAITLESDQSTTGPLGELDFFGSGLSFTNGHFDASNVYEGTLLGTLQDGHAINARVAILSPLTPVVIATPTEVRFTAGAVPEPASALMLGLGLAGVLAVARARRRD